MFVNNRFYIAANLAVTATTYSFSIATAALLDSFPQPGHSRYGIKDLDWDGELLWGSGEDTFME